MIKFINIYYKEMTKLGYNKLQADIYYNNQIKENKRLKKVNNLLDMIENAKVEKNYYTNVEKGFNNQKRNIDHFQIVL